jgi:tetratricopeptide (TPR) repeat protein
MPTCRTPRLRPCNLAVRRAGRVGVLALVAALAAACGGGSSNARVAALASAMPATLEPSVTSVAEPRVAKVRVWADAGVRAQPRWRESLLEQIDTASQYWTPLFGVRIEVVGVRDWERSAAPSVALQELAALDPGDDVAWVVGYTGPDGTASIAMSELGSANLLRKQIIVHDWSPNPERKKLEGQVKGLSAEERDEVLAAHRRHKQAVVLLYYLHASAGAILENDDAWIGSRGYSPGLRTISDRNRELLAVSLSSRLDNESLGAAAARLIDEIERADSAGWVASERDSAVAQLRALVSLSREGKVAQDVPGEALPQVQRAQDLLKRGDAVAAVREIEPLLAAYPANAALHQLRCEALLVKPGVADEATQSACERARELAPGDPRPDVAVARAWEAAGDRGKARAALEAATGKARAMAAPAEFFASILELYRAMGALSWTEEVVAVMPPSTSDQASAAAQWVAGVRARYGVPRGAAFVAPQDEGALVSGVRQSLDAVYADKYGDAERLLAELGKRWPRAPGLFAVRCDLALRREQIAEARRQCAAALRADDGQSWAHYLAGILALRGPDTAGGISHLRRAIALDGDLAQAWRALGKALQRSRDKAALAKLAVDYQARFGQPLP